MTVGLIFQNFGKTISLKRLTFPVNGGTRDITACQLWSKKNSPEKFLRWANHSERSQFMSKYLKGSFNI